MKNLYKKIARIFGLKLKQKFTTNKRDGKLFMFTPEGLMKWNEKDEAWKEDLKTLSNLLKGLDTVKKCKTMKLTWEEKDTMKKLIGKRDFISAYRTVYQDGSNCVYVKRSYGKEVDEGIVEILSGSCLSCLEVDKIYHPWEFKL